MNRYNLLKSNNQQNPAEVAVQEKEISSTEKFFEILMSGRNDLISPNIIVGFFLCIAFIFMIVPWQTWGDEDVKMGFFAAFLFEMGVDMYLNPYTKITEKHHTTSVRGKLKYYPVDTGAMKRYLLKKTENFTRKVFLAALIMQFVASLIGYHTLTFANVLYVVIVAYLWPMIYAFGIIVLSK